MITSAGWAECAQSILQLVSSWWCIRCDLKVDDPSPLFHCCNDCYFAAAATAGQRHQPLNLRRLAVWKIKFTLVRWLIWLIFIERIYLTWMSSSVGWLWNCIVFVDEDSVDRCLPSSPVLNLALNWKRLRMMSAFITTTRTGMQHSVTAVSSILKKCNTSWDDDDDDEPSVLFLLSPFIVSDCSLVMTDTPAGNKTIVCTMNAATTRQPMIILALRTVQSFDRFNG